MAKFLSHTLFRVVDTSRWRRSLFFIIIIDAYMRISKLLASIFVYAFDLVQVQTIYYEEYIVRLIVVHIDTRTMDSF